MPDQVGNPEDRFSHVVAHISSDNALSRRSVFLDYFFRTFILNRSYNRICEIGLKITALCHKSANVQGQCVLPSQKARLTKRLLGKSKDIQRHNIINVLYR